jgi:CheY-like chemotaxis protein
MGFSNPSSRPALRSDGPQIADTIPAASERLAVLSSSMRHTSQLVRPAPLLVLLVDDCPFQQLLACALLSRWGIMPQLASDGLEAVLLAGEQEFDIILMDLEMPVMDGLTATVRIRARERANQLGKQVPVVAYTTTDVYANQPNWQNSGMNALLKKPSDALGMSECLGRWCPCKFKATRH